MKQNYPSDILASLFHQYFPEKEIVSYTICEGGIENTNFLIDTGFDKYVLKIFEGAKNHEEVIKTEVSMMIELKKKGIAVPAIYLTTGNHNVISGPDGKSTILMEYISGAKYRDEPLDRDSLFLLGESIAEFDLELLALTPKYTAPDGHMYDLKYIMEHPGLRSCMPDYANLKLMEEVWDEIESVKGTFLSLPQQIIHNDLHSSNILFANGKPYFLDFSDFLMSPIVQEVATSLVSWCFHHFWYPEGMMHYLRGFQSITPLSDSEKDMLFACIECRMLNILMTPFIEESGIDEKNHSVFLKRYYFALVRFHEFGKENFMKFIP